MIYDIDYDLKREATKYSWRQWHGNSSGVVLALQLSGDSWMYPYQRTPMGNPYISPI